MIEIIKNPNIDFISKRKYGFAFSAILMIAALLLIIIQGPNFGIDFTGGALLQIQFSEPITTGELRSTLAKIGQERSEIQSLGVEKREYIIRAAEEKPVEFSRSVKQVLQEDYPDNPQQVLREETVEPKIGKELLRKTVWAIVIALVLILLYVSFRFDYRFGMAAVIALFHDALFTVGVLVLTQREFSIVVVGALLTIIGYSIMIRLLSLTESERNTRRCAKSPIM